MKLVLYVCAMVDSKADEDQVRTFYSFQHRKPSGSVHPLAIRAMGEMGIDISCCRSKHLSEFLNFKVHTVITVCGYVDQACPIFPGMMKRYHWGFDDPVKATGSEEEVFAVFCRVRDEIRKVFGVYAAGINLGTQLSR